MAQMVADVLVGTLEQIGVRHIFGLIGDSLNPLADAVRRSRIEWVGVRHEEGAALAAAGQAKLTGRLGVCAGTTGPGSTHLVAGLYEASRDHAPVLALSGDMPRKMHGHRLHPDDRAGPSVPRRLALHRDHFVARAGAGRDPPGDRGRLRRARRRPPDAPAGRHWGKGGGRRFQRRDLEAATRDRCERRRHRRDRPPDRCGRPRRDHVRRPAATARPTSCARCRTGSRRR